jgi:hypothetical protein
MSRNDYTKYARENKVEPAVEKPEALVVEPEVVEAPVVESEPIVHPEGVFPIPVEEPEIPDNQPTPPAYVMGRVIGCAKLNVRRAPKPRAEVLCEINCDSEVEVIESESTIDFYKICTAAGVEGYCVKTYISIASNK